jgi:NAD(P)-dependent dehydrogenase (short-subunit alcohol dehydrogenase family)
LSRSCEEQGALITLGATGIGLETARQFLKDAARVAITGANPETLAAAAPEAYSAVIRGPAGGSRR